MSKYITQSFNLYKDFSTYENYKSIPYSMDKTLVRPIMYDEFIQHQYLFIVAEPGFGKTRLLKQLTLNPTNSKNIYYLDAKRIKDSIENSLEKIPRTRESKLDTDEKLIAKGNFTVTDNAFKDAKDSIVCIDALDELSFKNISEFFDNLDTFIHNHPNTSILITCRDHHIKRFKDKIYWRFDSLKIVQIQQFTDVHIEEYLGTEVFKNLEQYNDRYYEIVNFLTTPRYLYYFKKLLDENGIESLLQMSKLSLFEAFIYHKLEIEKDKVPHMSDSLIKSTLETIALIMKLCQTDTLTLEEFDIIIEQSYGLFKDVLKSEELLQIFKDRSLIKDNIDSLEFENKEFLDFLAAKKILSFTNNIESAFFKIGVDAVTNEVKTPWFDTLIFLLEGHPKLAEHILTYIQQDEKVLIQSEYFKAFLQTDSKQLTDELRDKIFLFVFNYHQSHDQYLYECNNLAFHYQEQRHEKIILDSIDESLNIGDNLIVKRSNVVYLIGVLYKNHCLSKEQIQYWKNEFFKWLHLDTQQYRALHESIVRESEYFAYDDFEWIKSIKFIFEKGIELQYTYANVCNALHPNDMYSIETYFQTKELYELNKARSIITGDIGIAHILSLTSAESLEYAMGKLINNDNAIGEDSYEEFFLCFNELSLSNYQRKITKFLDTIRPILTTKMTSYLKTYVYIIISKHRFSHTNDTLAYVKDAFVDFLMQHDEQYIFEYLRKCKELIHNNLIYFFQVQHNFLDSFIKHIHISNIDEVVKLTHEINTEPYRKYDMLPCLYRVYSNTTDDKLKQKIKVTYHDSIAAYETKLRKQMKSEKDYTHEMELFMKHVDTHDNAQFKNLISYHDNIKHFPKFEEYKTKVIQSALIILKNYNPLNATVKIEGNSTKILNTLREYYDCTLIALTYENNLSKNVINNIYRYLPFCEKDEFKTLRKLLPKISKDVIDELINIYTGKRNDDLQYYNTSNLLGIFKYQKLSDDVLTYFLENEKIKYHCSEQLLSLFPKDFFTENVLRNYIERYDHKDLLFEPIFGILISKFESEEILEQAKFHILQEIKKYLHYSFSIEKNFFLRTFTNSNYPFDYNKEFLDLAMQYIQQGEEYRSRFLVDLVCLNIKNHLDNQDSTFYKKVEDYLQSDKQLLLRRFESNFIALKKEFIKSYASFDINNSIQLYKEVSKLKNCSINSHDDLKEVIINSFSNEVKSFLEIDGYYKSIQLLAKEEKRLLAEDFIQKHLLLLLENAFLKRNIYSQLSISREEQSLDGKRVDFVIRHNFIQPVAIEFKLNTNTEANVSTQNGKEYINTLQKYMGYTKSASCLFVIFNIEKDNDKKFKEQLEQLTNHYSSFENITVLGLNCLPESLTNPKM